MSDKQEVEKKVEGFYGSLFCTNGNATLGVIKEMIGNGMAAGSNHKVEKR